jgi:hypothetical protein
MGIRAVGLLCCAGSVLATNLAAQDADLTLPPRLDDAPGEARLAERPLQREDALEEVLVVGESQWRLPDLGSTWRANEDARKTDGRIQASLLPLYDPGVEQPDFDPMRMNRELQRVGFIELFRVRFGNRNTTD